APVPSGRDVCAGVYALFDLRRQARPSLRRLLPDRHGDAGDAGVDRRREGGARRARRARRGVLESLRTACRQFRGGKPVNKGSWPALETITALLIDIVREYDEVGFCVGTIDDRVRKRFYADPPDQPPLPRAAASRAWHTSRHDSDSLPSEIGRSGYWCGQGSSRSIHAILAKRSPAL